MAHNFKANLKCNVGGWMGCVGRGDCGPHNGNLKSSVTYFAGSSKLAS
jgi:hypothetical protein